MIMISIGSIKQADTGFYKANLRLSTSCLNFWLVPGEKRTLRGGEVKQKSIKMAPPFPLETHGQADCI